MPVSAAARFALTTVVWAAGAVMPSELAASELATSEPATSEPEAGAAAPIAARTAPGGLQLQPIAGLFVQLGAYLQADYIYTADSRDQLADDDGALLNRHRFAVTRARLRASASYLWIELSGELHASTLGGPLLGVRRLEAALRWPAAGEEPALVRLGAGVVPVPFGYEVFNEANTVRAFTERAMISRALVPGESDVGMLASGAWRFVHWAAAVQNGQPLEGDAFPGEDPNGDKDVAGRLWAPIGITDWLHVTAGASALYGHGFHPGTRPGKDQLVWRDGNEDGIATPAELQLLRGAAATPSESFERWGIGLDAQVRVRVPVLGDLLVYGEYLHAVNLDRGVVPADPVFLGRDQRGEGGYAALAQDVWSTETWRLFVAARFDHYVPSLDAFDVQGGATVVARRPFTTWTFAGGGQLNAGSLTARLLGDYAWQDNALGRDATGRPARLPNDTFRLRLEVAL